MRTNETNTGVRRNFDNCKVRIPDEETSKKVQERLFELGYVWNSGFKDVLNLYYNKEFWVNMNEGKTLTHSPTEHTDPEYNEVSVADILGDGKCSCLITGEHKSNLEGTFTWAVDMMKIGKKVTRKDQTWFCYLYENSFKFETTDRYPLGSNPYMSYEDIEATDWEIYEEPKKTLYDKIVVYELEDDRLVRNKLKDISENPTQGVILGSALVVNDVKEALKEYFKKLKYEFELMLLDQDNGKLPSEQGFHKNSNTMVNIHSYWNYIEKILENKKSAKETFGKELVE